MPGPEAKLQQAIMEALAAHRCQVYSTSAPRQKGPSGVTPGIPDLLVFRLTAPNFCFAEVKTPSGKLTAHQHAFRSTAHWAGVDCQVWRSVQDAIDWVKSARDDGESVDMKAAMKRLRGVASDIGDHGNLAEIVHESVDEIEAAVLARSAR